MPDAHFSIQHLGFVIADSPFVIPDSIRDPVIRLHWIAGRARNDKGNDRQGNSSCVCNFYVP
jgi:hypothetical protein